MPLPLGLALVPFASAAAAPAPALQEAAAPFDAPVFVVQEVSAPILQRLFDYDGDGFLDAAGTKSQHLGVWHNDGQGGLVQVLDQILFTSVSIPTHVETGDFDGDGLCDLVLAEKDGYRIHTSLGTGAFTSVTVEVNPELIDLATGDLDLDGKCDIAVLKGQFGQLSSVHVVFGDGHSLTGTTTLVDAQALRVLEGNGDGTGDLLVARDESARLHFVTASALEPGAAFTASSAWDHFWTAGDVEGDGDDDIVVFNDPASGIDPEHYDLFLRTGTSTFEAQPNAPGGRAESLADVDGDGDLDGIACFKNTFPSFEPFAEFESDFAVALNEGGHSFAPAFEIPWSGASALGAAGDLDLDGDVDLAAGRCVLYARGPLNAPPMPRTDFNAAIFRQHRIGDADRDGDPEPHTTWKLGPWNQGDGTFASNVAQPFPTVPAGETLTGPLWSGDFTGDGAYDWIYTRYDTSTIPWKFLHQELVANAGGGGYLLAGPAIPPGIAFEPYENSVDNGFSGDGDDDGDVDLFIKQVGIHTEFYPNDGTGHFTHPWTLSHARAELLADFNADGITDVLATDFYLYVYLGLPGAGPPYFSDRIKISSTIVTQEERELTAADFNDDGWTDIALADSLGKPWVLFNTTPVASGIPAFSSLWLGPAYETDDAVRPRVVGLDANGDGLTDLVVGPSDDLSFAAFVFLRRPGTAGVLTLSDYEAPVLQLLPGLYPSDVDDDGDTDLFGGCIARNPTHDPAYGDGSRLQSETPSAGTGAMVPVLGATGPFRAGATVHLRLSGALGGSLSILVFSPHSAHLPDFPLPGIDLFVDPFLPGFVHIPFPLGGPPGAPGAGFWEGPGLFVPSALAGLTFHHQAFVIDGAAPSSVVHSNRLTLSYGP